MAASIFSWLMIQSTWPLYTHTHTHTNGYGYLSVARGDAHVEREQQTLPSLVGRVFPTQHADLNNKSAKRMRKCK